MSLAYRGLEHVAASRFAELAERRTQEIASLVYARVVYTRRFARTIAGGVGTLGAVFVFITAAVGMLSNGKFFGSSEYDGKLTLGLLACWPAAFVAYLFARLTASHSLSRMLSRPLTRRGDAVHDLARLETSHPAHLLEHAARRLESWSAVLPLVMLSFLAPLTIHFVVGHFLARGDGGLTAKSYDEWIGVSVAIVGHAHLVLAICALRFGRKLAVRDTAHIASGVHNDWLKAFGITILAGAVPGAVFFLIPPIVVALTGLVFVPAMYIFMGRRIVSERNLLDEVCDA